MSVQRLAEELVSIGKDQYTRSEVQSINRDLGNPGTVALAFMEDSVNRIKRGLYYPNFHSGTDGILL
jgi:hypothetical protein